MNVQLHIARKYFFSAKKKAFINLISILAICIVWFATAAMVIIISAMNGFTEYIKKYEGALEGDIKITAIKGKTFELTQDQITQIKGLEGVEFVTEVLEDHAFAVNYLGKNERKQQVVKLKGVSGNFYEHFQFEDFNGTQTLHLDERPTAIIGHNIARSLGLFGYNEIQQRAFVHNKFLQLLYPSRSGKNKIKSLNDNMVMAVAAFQQVNYDTEYIIVPIETAAELFGYDKERTAIEVVCAIEQLDQIESEIKKIVGDGFNVKNKDEQNEVLLKAIKLEKLVVFIILVVVFAIASLNIFFSLSMLEIEKRKDIAVLHAVGMNSRTIKRTFIYVGGFIAFTGGMLGFISGHILCYIQMNYGILQVSNGEPYPIQVQFLDNLFLVLAVISITILASIRPAVKASKVKFELGL